MRDLVVAVLVVLLCQLTDPSGGFAAAVSRPEREFRAAPSSVEPTSSAEAMPTESEAAGIAPTFVSGWDRVPQVPMNAAGFESDLALVGFATEIHEASHRTAQVSEALELNSQVLESQEFSQETDEEFLIVPTAMSMQADVSSDDVTHSLLAHDQTSQLPTLVDQGNRRSWLQSPLQRGRRFLSRKLGADLGIGHERVMFAPLVIDTAIATPSTSVLFRADRGLATPDRLEYFWAAPSRGPPAESRVDILDVTYRMVLGSEKMSAFTDYTMRSLNPERNDNTVGFGDMRLGAKATVINGRCTKVATIFTTYLKTGPSSRGLGTGHVSLEPGLLLRHQMNQHTYFHGEIKYWLPIAGTPGHAGDVLKTGAALSTVWRENDRYALLPTLEILTYAFLAGSTTQPNGLTRRVNGDFAAEIYPGLRCVLGPQSELGLLEFGISPGIVLADNDWFDSRLAFEVRIAR